MNKDFKVIWGPYPQYETFYSIRASFVYQHGAAGNGVFDANGNLSSDAIICDIDGIILQTQDYNDLCFAYKLGDEALYTYRDAINPEFLYDLGFIYFFDRERFICIDKYGSISLSLKFES